MTSRALKNQTTAAKVTTITWHQTTNGASSGPGGEARRSLKITRAGATVAEYAADQWAQIEYSANGNAYNVLVKLTTGRNRRFDGVRFERSLPQPAPTLAPASSFSNMIVFPEVAMLKGASGRPLPTLTIRRVRADTKPRLVRALAYELAAAIERATPETERWVLEIFELADGSGGMRISIECSAGDGALEAGRALHILAKVAAEELS